MYEKYEKELTKLSINKYNVKQTNCDNMGQLVEGQGSNEKKFHV